MGKWEWQDGEVVRQKEREIGNVIVGVKKCESYIHDDTPVLCLCC